MKELGSDSKSLHLAFKEDIKEHNLLLISIGEMMNHLYEALDYNNKLAHYDNIEQAIGNIAKYIKDGDHILVKGSNSTGISKIVNLFTNNQNLQEAS
jgi:UDP-N-acetylmuramoyl-tripeptide--D-alanyl-D-alanine ligase